MWSYQKGFKGCQASFARDDMSASGVQLITFNHLSPCLTAGSSRSAQRSPLLPVTQSSGLRLASPIGCPSEHLRAPSPPRPTRNEKTTPLGLPSLQTRDKAQPSPSFLKHRRRNSDSGLAGRMTCETTNHWEDGRGFDHQTGHAQCSRGFFSMPGNMITWGSSSQKNVRSYVRF